VTATNHAVFGALTVAVISNPVIGLPLALLSHFALDSLPHFGAHTIAEPGSREFNSILIFDITLGICVILVVGLAGSRTGYPWWLLPVGAILGMIPDLMWLKHYRNDIHGEEKHWDKVRHVHKKIQNWELSWGWIIEIIWYVATVGILSQVLFA